MNVDCFEYMSKIESSSIDLILTDPPYSISKNSNFNKSSISASDFIKTKYTTHSIDFGDWDKDLNMDILFKEYYRILKPGGTLLIFFDIWKSNQLKEMANKYKFKQPRVGIWIKNNPTPINSNLNYLSNAHEFFFSFIKGKNPTFNSKYDNAVYKYPLCHGKERLNHPTQKPLGLIKDLIEKHSNVGDMVIDTFSGSGTTAEACVITGRKFICIEKDKDFFDISVNRLKQLKLDII